VPDSTQRAGSTDGVSGVPGDDDPEGAGEAGVGTGDASVSVLRPAEVVWAKLGDFGGIDNWMPGVDSCVVEGDVRKLSVFGMDITERLLARDEAGMTLEYAITESPLNAESHLGRVTVRDEGAACHIVWHVEVAPPSLTQLLVDTYQQALNALKTNLEGETSPGGSDRG